jgi:hypothetical protein
MVGLQPKKGSCGLMIPTAVKMHLVIAQEYLFRIRCIPSIQLRYCAPSKCLAPCLLERNYPTLEINTNIGDETGKELCKYLRFQGMTMKPIRDFTHYLIAFNKIALDVTIKEVS